MKILHIAPNFPYSKLYNQLISKIEEKDIHNEVYVQSEKAEINASYPVHYLGRSFGILDRLLYFRKQKIILDDILHRKLYEGVDVIHAHNLFSAGFCAYQLKKKYNIPYIVAIRNSDVYDFFRYMIHLRHLGVRIMKESSAVIFISPAYKEYVIKKYVPVSSQGEIGLKSWAIPNGLDKYFFENSKRRGELKELEGQIRLLYVGDVDRNKNITTTLKACDILINRGVNIKYTVVGKIKVDNLKKELERKYVEYIPYSPKEVVKGIMAESDIFVMPSIHETFGLVYIEAMSQGLPIIYTKGQGVDGYFQQGEVGFSVDCKDAKAIADSIEKIIKDYARISERSSDAILNFSWDAIADKYVDLYKKNANQG